MYRDNSIFLSDQFHLECNNKHQEQYFSGVVAQHQNAKEEISIKTIMYTARIFMVQYYLHQIDYGADKISLWRVPFKNTTTCE